VPNKIQLPYINTFETIWKYEEAFSAGRINFFSSIGPRCPVCGKLQCYREISPYWRNAIELFPEFKKKQIPIARFLCRKKKSTFSLLPIQLIPYFQYTVGAVIGILQLGLQCRQMGQQGFWGALMALDEVSPDNLLTPWLIACWLSIVLRGLRRGHAVLGRFYDLSGFSTPKRDKAWKEVFGYLLAFGCGPEEDWPRVVTSVLVRYGKETKQFLIGTPSQQRPSR
jgi:hypothetical protein